MAVAASNSAICGVTQTLEPGLQVLLVGREIDLGYAWRRSKRRSSSASLPPMARMSSSVRASQRITHARPRDRHFRYRRPLPRTVPRRARAAAHRSGRYCWRTPHVPSWQHRRRRRCRDVRRSREWCRRWSARMSPDFIDVVVRSRIQSERLLRRRDVVALRAEHDDRRSDVAQIDRSDRPIS